jgi:hypothetical protein
MIVPKHEPEVISALARKLFRGDDEKVPTTMLEKSLFRGVLVESRYQKADEVMAMLAVLRRMDDAQIAMIDRVWCDSKAQACYVITVREGVYDEWGDDIRASFHAYCMQENGGHNGFDVVGHDGEEICYQDPEWPEEPDD